MRTHLHRNDWSDGISANIKWLLVIQQSGLAAVALKKPPLATFGDFWLCPTICLLTVLRAVFPASGFIRTDMQNDGSMGFA